MREERVRASRRVVETLLKDLELRAIQLPCPELLYKGLGRKPASRKTYGNPEFRRIRQEIGGSSCKI